MPKVFTIATLIALFGFTVYATQSHYWTNLFVVAFGSLIIVVPHVLHRWYGFVMPARLHVGIAAFVFSTLVLGEIEHFYKTFVWWDLMLHFVAGAGLTIFGFTMLRAVYSQSALNSTPTMTSLFALSFTALVALLWEGYEYAIDSLGWSKNPMQPSNADTMQDMLVALLAAIVVVGFTYRRLKYQEENVVSEIIDETGKESDVHAVDVSKQRYDDFH